MSKLYLLKWGISNEDTGGGLYSNLARLQISRGSCTIDAPTTGIVIVDLVIYIELS